MKKLSPETRNLIKLMIIVAMMLLMKSCTVSHLHYSKNYRITSLEGDTATFAGVKGKYTLPKEGLKTGQKIYLKRTALKSKANVKPIK